jgi:hypothetical protein
MRGESLGTGGFADGFAHSHVRAGDRARELLGTVVLVQEVVGDLLEVGEVGPGRVSGYNVSRIEQL